MAADSQAIVEPEATEVEAPVVRKSSGSNIGFDASLAPTCMIWSMFVVLGALILIVIIWAIPNFALLFK